MVGKKASFLPVLFSCSFAWFTYINKHESLLLAKVIAAILCVEIKAAGDWKGTYGSALQEKA
jgi:hypothetical protein